MRILFLSPYLPCPVRHGGQNRTLGMIRALARFASVHVLAIGDPREPSLAEAREALRALGVTLEVFLPTGPGPSEADAEDTQRLPDAVSHFRSPDLARALADRLAGGWPDLIHLEELVMAQYAEAFSVPCVVDRQKVEWAYHEAMAVARGEASASHLREAVRFRRWEESLAGRFAAILVTGAGDRDILAPVHGLEVLRLVPIAIDDRLARPPDRTGEVSHVLLYGTVDYPPNVEANALYFREVWPRLREASPALRTIVVGSGLAPDSIPRGDSRVELRGFVDDVGDVLRGPGVLVAPLRVGGGSRTKILEALACGMPVVSTRVGVENLGLEPGRHYLEAETPDEMAAAVLRLVGDAGLAASLGREGARRADPAFRQETIARGVEPTYREAAARRIQSRRQAARGSPSRPLPGTLLLAAFAVVFLAMRTTHLMTLPVFVDEAIHLRWAFRVAEAGNLLGETEGGRYLPIWLYSLVATGAPDPLRAARMCSVVFGLVAALGLVGLGRAFGSEGVGLLAALLYLLAPFTLFYDRLALVESLLCALVAWGLTFAALWVRTARLHWGLALGLVAGAAGATKLYGALLLVLPAVFLRLVNDADRLALRRQLRWIYAAAGVGLLPVLLELRLHLRFTAENLWLFRSGPDSSPAFLPGLGHALRWQWEYLTPLGSLLVLLAVADALRARDRLDRLLLALWGGWCLFFVATWGRNWFPRYLLPGLVPILFLAARRAVLAGRSVTWALLAPFALAALRFDAAILTDPAAAPLPGIDHGQYVEEWPAGYGLAPAAAFVTKVARARGRLVVLRHARSGPLLESLDLALRRPAPFGPNDRIETRELDFDRPGASTVLAKLRAEPGTVVLALDEIAENELVLTLDGRGVAAQAASFLKPGLRRQMELYLVRGPRYEEQPPRDEPGSPALGSDSEGSAWQGLGILSDIDRCASELGSGSASACRRVLGHRVGGPVRAEALYHLGRQLLLRGLPVEAVAALREAERSYPHDLEQTLALADALEGLGRYEDALTALRAIAPFTTDPYLAARLDQRIAWDLAMLGRWTEAEATLRRSVAADPSFSRARNDLGVCLWIFGRRDEAVESLRTALGLDGEGLRVRYNDTVLRAARER